MVDTDEVEWEDVDEQLVVVELSGVIDSEFLYKCSTAHCRLLGVETNEPVLQIGAYTFVGQYSDAFGTHVIFEETEDVGTKKLRYFCHTNKTLEMRRAFLKKKKDHIVASSDEH